MGSGIFTSRGGAKADGDGVPRPDEVTVHVQGEGPASEALPSRELDALPTGHNYWGYHLKMAIICCYMAMLLTDWGVPDGLVAARTYTIGYASAWLQMSMNWTCGLLYCWTLGAPRTTRTCRSPNSSQRLSCLLRLALLCYRRPFLIHPNVCVCVCVCRHCDVRLTLRRLPRVPVAPKACPHRSFD